MSERSMILSVGKSGNYRRTIPVKTLSARFIRAFNKKYDRMIDVLFNWTN
jgi:hypothetical protein